MDQYLDRWCRKLARFCSKMNFSFATYCVLDAGSHLAFKFWAQRRGEKLPPPALFFFYTSHSAMNAMMAIHTDTHVYFNFLLLKNIVTFEFCHFSLWMIINFELWMISGFSAWNFKYESRHDLQYSLMYFRNSAVIEHNCSEYEFSTKTFLHIITNSLAEYLLTSHTAAVSFIFQILFNPPFLFCQK